MVIAVLADDSVSSFSLELVLSGYMVSTSGGIVDTFSITS
jgi:hypothetical protein